MLVLAGPGSGKTYVITHRIVHLISECKIPPEKILVITFTKAAALEMQSRAVSLMHQCAYVQYGTFHSVFYGILRLAYPQKKLELVSDRERYDFIRNVLTAGDTSERETDNRMQECLRQISRRKNQFPDSRNQDHKKDNRDREETEKSERIYLEYQQWLEENQKLDFDDMLLQCYEYLRKYPSEREKWQSRFAYILIDEFQDINALQYETIKLLSGNHNIFAVGDDDQTIYSFRGSDPLLMKRFEKEFGAQMITLRYNYRCSGNITKAAGSLIAHNRKRYAKQIEAVGEPGENIMIRHVQNLKEESGLLCEEVRRYREENPDRTQAILVRTNNGVAMYGKLFGTSETKPADPVWEDLSAYLKFLWRGRKREDFLKIMNKPERYISRRLLLEPVVDFHKLRMRLSDKPWIEKRVEKLEAQVDFITGLDLPGQLRYIWKAMGYGKYLELSAEGKCEKMKENAGSFANILQNAHNCHTYEQLKEKMESDRSGKDEQSRGQKDGEAAKERQVRIMTYHGAKGLEFDRVYLPDLNYGKVPHGRMLTAEELEEERRMFYVAVTRAKESLVLFRVKEQTASPFLAELMS